MTLLSIIQDTCDEIGIARPTQVVASTDQQVRQLFALVKREGKELAKVDWEVLKEEYSFVTVGQEVQTNAPVPDDLDRFIDNTFFNRTTAREIVGPITARAWQLAQARPVETRIYLAFRKRGGQFMITPVPAAGETIAYEYVSKNWAQSSAGQPKPTFTSDDDTTFLDEELMKLGLIWRWKAAKGLPYAEDMATYERAVQQAAGEDGGATAISITGSPDVNLMAVNLPEGGFGL